MAFRAFPAEGVDFYEQLEADNTRSFWQANKHRFDEFAQGLLDQDHAEAGLARTGHPNNHPVRGELVGLDDEIAIGAGAGPLVRGRIDGAAQEEVCDGRRQ